MDAVAAALARREQLRRAGHTAFRVLNGRGDGIPGLWIDHFAGRWLVQTTADQPPNGLESLLALPEVEAVYWKRLAQHNKQPPRPVAGATDETCFDIVENGLLFGIDLANGYSQGLFLDQRENRALVRHRASGLRVLNTFAYTCGFGVAAAAGNAAETVNLDLSRHYLAWGAENYARNQLTAHKEDFIFGDTLDWLERFAKRGRQFDLVILDPPTFARGTRHGTFRVERDYGMLVAMALRLLPASGCLLAFANEHRLSLPDFLSQVASATSDTGFQIRSTCDRMAVDFPGSRHLKKITIAGPDCQMTD